MATFFAFLHHVAAFTLVSALAVEFVLIRQELTLTSARRLPIVDAVLGVSAGLLLIVGLLRVFYFEKGEVVAYVGVAVSGIIPQAPVKWKRLIKLVDPLAGVIDGRRNVRGRRRLGQRQRWCRREAEPRERCGGSSVACPERGQER
jgi:hypothetical protein